MTFTAAFKKNKEDKKYSGITELYFDIADLSYLIEPLYSDVKGITIWVYSPFYDIFQMTYVEPAYNQTVYSTTNETLSESVFQILYDGILVPEVIESPPGAENKVFYS